VDVAVYETWTEVFACEVDSDGIWGRAERAQPKDEVVRHQDVLDEAVAGDYGHVMLEGAIEGVDDAGVGEDVFWLLGRRSGL